MSQIMYNYPAMLGHSADMSGYAGTLHAIGADIATEQSALQSAWQGDTGVSYQAFSYELKCAGKEFCTYTNGFEVGYSITQAWSVSAMLVAVAYACTLARRGVMIYALANAVVYTIVAIAGVLLPSIVLLSFEVLMLFALPGIILVIVLAARSACSSSSRISGARLGATLTTWASSRPETAMRTAWATSTALMVAVVEESQSNEAMLRVESCSLVSMRAAPRMAGWGRAGRQASPAETAAARSATVMSVAMMLTGLLPSRRRGSSRRRLLRAAGRR